MPLYPSDQLLVVSIYIIILTFLVKDHFLKENSQMKTNLYFDTL